jgi:ADP-heptose:LPS heptosyltransferase
MSKKIGIWMDHSHAHLKEFRSEAMESFEKEYDLATQKKAHLFHGESSMHNKEESLHTEFYKNLSKVIAEYKEVLLFGPTEAKSELYNVLKADHQFANIKIEVKNSGQLSDKQERAVIRAHFQ